MKKSNILSYSFPQLLVEFKKNQPLIKAYFKGDLIEGADDDSKKILGLSVALFVVLFLISLILWVWALIALMRNWHNLPTWAQVLGLIILFGFFVGPVGTLIIVYVARK